MNIQLTITGGEIALFVAAMLLIALGAIIWIVVRKRGLGHAELRHLALKGAVRFVLCVAILALGAMSFKVLAALKKPPAAAVSTERAIRVEAMAVQPEDYQVTLRGTGEVRTLNTVSIAPEVAGRVVELHPSLEVGEVIAKGETLFIVDPRTYQAQVAQSNATVAQWKTTIERLKTQMTQDRARLATLKRTRDLAEGEFNRLKKLFAEDQVGTQSAVDLAEQAYNSARDAVDRLEQALEVYPIQIEEAGNSLKQVEAVLELQEINLERTTVVAPFDARVKQVDLEVGQMVQPGAPVLLLADDSLLEISVPLDSEFAQQWLKFNGERPAEGKAWFTRLEPVTCEIHWLQDPDDHVWNGVLDRVEKYEQTTRTVYIAVRIEGGNAISQDDSRLPLVEGMFCEVRFPGRTLKNVYRIPQWAVTFENEVYVATSENRLQKRDVVVARKQDDVAFIANGLEPGDVVIITRLVNPLEGSLLDVEAAESEETAS